MIFLSTHTPRTVYISIAPLDVDGGSLGVWLAGMMIHRVHSRRFVSALDARRAGTHEYPGVCRVGEWASQRVARSANLAKVMGAIQRCPVVTATGAWEIGEGTDFALDVELAANISSVLAGTTVADFGAGVGALCKYLEIDDRVAATQVNSNHRLLNSSFTGPPMLHQLLELLLLFTNV